MGFQAESATWRNAYLLGAHEYREGPPKPLPDSARPGHLEALDAEALFDTLAARVNTSRAAALGFNMDWTHAETDEHWLPKQSNGALHAHREHSLSSADAAVRQSRITLHPILRGELPAAEAVASEGMKLDCDASLFLRPLDLLDAFTVCLADVKSVPWPDR